MQKQIQEQINALPYPLDKILNTANSLLRTGTTGELIAAAFVLERMEYLPQGSGVIEAWEGLDGEWQYYVKHLRQDYRHLIEAIEEAASPF